MKLALSLFFSILAFGVATPAHAYIGPGAGLGAIAATIALALGVLLLIVGLVWYPLKRIMKRRSGGASDGGTKEKAE